MFKEISLDHTHKLDLDRLRTRARRNGLRLEKSRQKVHLNNRGGLMLVDAYRNTVVAGVDYDLDLDTAAYWIDLTIQKAA